jgi:hypothetical protein
MPDEYPSMNPFPSEALESPEWHWEILEEHERQIASGEARFIDWEQAKADIRKMVSGQNEPPADQPNIPRQPGL